MPVPEPHEVDPIGLRKFVDGHLVGREEDKELLRQALTAWERATERGTITAKEVQQIVAAATHRRLVHGTVEFRSSVA